MRLRITRWATRDQDGDRIETLTTCGQSIQEAGVSLPARSPTQRCPIVTADRPSMLKAIRLSSTSTINRRRQSIFHFETPDFAARLHRLVRRLTSSQR